MSYIGIHNHTDSSNFRLRDSINKLVPLIEYAHSLGHKGIAITEHECISSSLNAIKFYDSVRNTDEWKDFKVLCGNEIYLCPSYVSADYEGKNIFPHFILVALNGEGHKQIRELSTIAWSHSFKQFLVRVPTYYEDLERIITRNRGNVIGSSACIGGALPRHLLEMREMTDEEKSQRWLECIDWIQYMTWIFGKGFFFLELQPSYNEDQIFVNEKLIKLSKETDTPYIISTDAHYLKKEDREAHKIYLSSQDGEREVDEFYATTYVMSEEEIHEYMDSYLGYNAVQKGIDNTMLIYDKAEFYDLRKDLYIPYIPLNKEEPDERLFNKYKDKIKHLSLFFRSKTDSDRHLIRELLKDMEKDPYYRTDKAYEAIDTCLKTIEESSNRMNTRWSAYLLQIADYVKIAWEAGTLVGAGRGSGVGFCLLNMLDITQINPLRETTQTYYWRFLNPERASVLDIDIDIEGSKRDVVINAMKKVYGEDRVSKVLTLSTEKSRSAILTAARGLNMDTDLAQYISSLIVEDRGIIRSLQVMYYGDPSNNIPPVYEFRNEMDKYPVLWDMAQKFEGLIKGVGSHAGGVIIVDEPFTETTALMKTNSGDIVTQFDLHMCEDCSLIKVDLLAIDALDKIHATLNLMLKDNVIQWQGSLKATYEKYLGVYTLERTNLNMWKMLWEHKVISFFQMEKESGTQAIALSKPKSVDDLATINSVMRLMAQESGGESPLHKYARFKNDITEWYQEMIDFGLTEEEQDILKDILGVSYGICEAQEYLFLLVMHPKIGGFSLAWADKLRKSVAKKSPKDFEKLQEEFFENAKQKHLSGKLINYVWFVLIFMQRGYGFNKSHTLAYSIIGLQELNLAYKYPIIYWNTANLIVDSGSLEGNDGSTDYGKVATAIATMKNEGIDVSLPLINEAHFSFVPDVKNNRIIYSLKAMSGIGTEEAETIVAQQPYISLSDFIERTKLKPTSCISLIKAGAFNELDNLDRTKTMKKYLYKYRFNAVNSLTLSQLKNLIKLDIIPEQYKLCVKIKNFKDYVIHPDGLYSEIIDPSKSKIPKCGYHDRTFILDDQSMPFFKEHFTEESIVGIVKEYYIVSEKKFLKEVEKKIEPLKEWMKDNDILNLYNQKMFEIFYEESVPGTVPKWEMDSLSFYYTEHELAHMDNEYYGVVDFFSLPEQPKPYAWYRKKIDNEIRNIPKNKIDRIAGTVIQKFNNKHMIVLLTVNGVVNVKFGKGAYAYYNRRISKDGSVIDDSWFKKGTKLLICGYRRDKQFIPYKYSDTVYQHTVMKINTVLDNGRLEINTERMVE